MLDEIEYRLYYNKGAKFKLGAEITNYNINLGFKLNGGIRLWPDIFRVKLPQRQHMRI